MYKYRSLNVFHLAFSGFLLMKSGIFLQNHSGNTDIYIYIYIYIYLYSQQVQQ